jgi:hypothetical protein
MKKEYNYEWWLDMYMPQFNHLVENAAYGGYMFETFGVEKDFVKNNSAPCIVWTLIDEGNKMFIVPGYHIFNRIGYFITVMDNKLPDGVDSIDMNEWITLEFAKLQLRNVLNELKENTEDPFDIEIIYEACVFKLLELCDEEKTLCTPDVTTAINEVIDILIHEDSISVSIYDTLNYYFNN